MALNWDAKAPGDSARRVWSPILATGDSISAFAVPVVSGATLADYTQENDTLAVFVSAGSAVTTATITLSATTANGETLTETIYLPIVAPTATGPTARDVIAFALRKINGLGSDPDADQEADALETLNDMLRLWKASGLDIGATFPLAASTVLDVRDEFLSAIKYNLRIACHNFYSAEITPLDMQFADASRRAASNLLTTFDDVTFSPTLAPTVNQVASLF